MTRKDFERIACIISWTTKGHDLTENDKLAINALLKETNPKFDKDRFWKAVWEYQNGRRVLK